MPRLSGAELEAVGVDCFKQLGVTAIGGLAQVLLRDFDPSGAHGQNDHFEFDYLIPQGPLCLVGEITDRSSPSDVEHKFSRFRKHFNTLRRLTLTDRSWRLLGVPSAKVRLF